jgi:SulP family sulfate permease
MSDPQAAAPAKDRWFHSASEWLPFLETFRGYRPEFLKRDLVSSLTVALLDVPQGIAYALIAGLPPIYGLYSSIVLALVSALFINSNHMVCGPTNAIAVVVASVLVNASPEIRAEPAAAVAILTFMAGVAQFAFGALKAGTLAQFVSRSVLTGFTCGAGLLIALNQLAPLLGISIPRSENLVGQIGSTFSNIASANPVSVGLGVGTIAVLIAGKKWLPRVPWAIVVVAASAAAVKLFGLDAKGVSLVGAIPSSLPSFSLPPFDLGLIGEISGGALAIAILGCVESMSIAKSISVSSGQRMNSNQDFVGIGLAHVAGSFFGCMPGCGSFTRSALNFQSGARSRLSGVFCAGWVALALLLLGPAMSYIPKASLAGMLVMLGISLIKWKQVRVAVRSTRSDAWVFFLTLVATLFLHLDTAVYIGVISSLVLFLRKASAPHLVEYDIAGDTMREISGSSERSNPQISIIHVEGELFFGAAELFEDEVRRLAKDPSIRVVVLRMKNARHLDATAVMALDALHRFLVSQNRLLLVSGASADVIRVLRGSGALDRIGAGNVFPAEENLTMATRKALLRAKEFLGTGERPDVRIFYEKTRAEKGAGSMM